MWLPGDKKWRAGRELRSGLAVEDTKLIGAASLIDYDHTQVASPGKRKEAIEMLAEVSERYCLDPELVTAILHRLHPELADITPPPHDDFEILAS